MAASRHRRTRSQTLFIALGLSAAAHFVVLPFLRMPASARAPETTPAPLGITIVERKPTPRPPTPPPPTLAPKPIVTHAEPHVVAAIDTPHLRSRVAKNGTRTHLRPTTNDRAVDLSGDIGPRAGAGSGTEVSRPSGDPTTEPVIEHPVEPTPTPLETPACAGVAHEASVIDAVTPDRPAIAREQGAVGRTQVRVDLSATGAVESAVTYRSSGNRALDDAAVEAARHARYAPASNGCAPIGGSYLYTVDYAE